MVRKRRLPKIRRAPSNNLLSRFIKLFSGILFWTIILFFITVAIIGGIFTYKMSNLDLNLLPRINFIFKTAPDEISLYLFDIQAKKLKQIDINQDIKIPVAYGYGYYRLTVLDELSAQEGYGVELMRDSVSHWLGINFAGVISTNTSKNSIRNIHSYLKSSSNLGFWEKIWIWNQLRQIPESRVERINLLEDYLGFESENYPRDYNTAVMNQFAKDHLNYPELLLSNYQIVIVNATKVPGLATFASHMLKNLGYDIVGVQDINQKKDKTEFLVESSLKLEPYFQKPIEQLYFGLVPNYQANVFTEYRGDVVIILGADYDELLYGK